MSRPIYHKHNNTGYPDHKLMDELNTIESLPYFHFVVYSIHPKVKLGIMGWSIEAKMKKPISNKLEIKLHSIMPYVVARDAKDGCWMMLWKGFRYSK